MRIPLRNAASLACIIAAVVMVGCGRNPNVDGARLDLRNKNYDRALENIAIALNADPNNSDALSLKGQVLLEMASEESDPVERAMLFSEMVHSFDRSAEIDSTFRKDHLRWMRLAYVEQFNEGIGLYDRAQIDNADQQKEAYEEAASRFHAATMIFPDSASAYFNEASAYYSAGMLDAAIRVFRLALDQGMTDRDLFVFLTATLENAAEAQEDSVERSRLMDDIVAVLHEANAVYPDDQELRTMLLNAFNIAGDDISARAFYEQELPNERGNKTFLYNYGTLLIRLGEYDEAISMLVSAVELDPRYTNAQFNLGAAYVNRAAGINEALRKAEEELKAAQSRLTAAEREGRDAALTRLGGDRRTMYARAIEHLVVAKTLTEAELGETQDICYVLYQAYGHIDLRQKAEEVAECAQIAR